MMKQQQGKQRTVLALSATAQFPCYALLAFALFSLLWFSTRSIATTLISTAWQTVPMTSNGTSSEPATTTPTAKPTGIHQNASVQLVRISQLNLAQYASQAEYDTWAYSACSTTAMTEVLNAYGHHYRIADVLQVEARIGAITPELGLVSEAGIQQTAAQFGFATRWGHDLSLDQIITSANNGAPVIISWPPQTYKGGHIVVVTGGDTNTVRLADSSLYNRTSISRVQFLAYWRGFSAILTPQGA